MSAIDFDWGSATNEERERYIETEVMRLDKETSLDMAVNYFGDSLLGKSSTTELAALRAAHEEVRNELDKEYVTNERLREALKAIAAWCVSRTGGNEAAIVCIENVARTALLSELEWKKEEAC